MTLLHIPCISPPGRRYLTPGDYFVSMRFSSVPQVQLKWQTGGSCAIVSLVYKRSLLTFVFAHSGPPQDADLAARHGSTALWNRITPRCTWEDKFFFFSPHLPSAMFQIHERIFARDLDSFPFSLALPHRDAVLTSRPAKDWAKRSWRQLIGVPPC